MNIEDLDFSSANNACLSLRIISERIRAGDWMLLDADKEGGTLTVQVIDRNSKVPPIPLPKRRPGRVLG